MDDPNKPPCVQLGLPLNWCARERMAERILGHICLPEPWIGWKFRGRELVSPDGLRVNPERLRGMLLLARAVDRRPPRAAAVVQLPLFEDTSATDVTRRKRGR